MVVIVPYIPSHNNICREYVCTQINNITQDCVCKPIESYTVTYDGILISLGIAIFVFLIFFIIGYYLNKGDYI